MRPTLDPPIPAPFTHRLPLHPQKLPNHAGLARPLRRLGPGGFCVERVFRRGEYPHTGPAVAGILKGSLGAAFFFCTFRKTRALCLASADACKFPLSTAPACTPKTGWLSPLLRQKVAHARVPPICPKRTSQTKTLTLSLSPFALQHAIGPSPGPPYQARSVRRCPECTEQCHCGREHRRRTGPG